MSFARHAATGYRAAVRATETPRSIERRVFDQVTAALRKVETYAPDNAAAYVEAVYDNRVLWETLTGDLLDEANGLPDVLKARVLGLGIFVRNFSSAAIAEKRDLGVLIEINTAIARGLRGDAGAGA